MKEAKVEAEQIVTAYRNEMEAKYKEKLMQVFMLLATHLFLLSLQFFIVIIYFKVTGKSGASSNELNTGTNNEINSMT